MQPNTATVNYSARPWPLVWIGLGAWLVYLLAPILTPFLVSALLAYLGDPLVDRLEARRVPRSAAVTLVFVVLFALVLALLLLLVPLIEGQISRLLERLPGYLEWARGTLLVRVQGLLPEGQWPDLPSLQKAISAHWGKAGGLLSWLWESVRSSGGALVLWLGNLLLIPVLTFYLLRDWDHLVAGVRALLPRSSALLWCRLAAESDAVLGAFLRGQLTVMAVLALIYSVGLGLAGLDLALLLGVFAGLLSFVPYLGPIVGIASAGVAAYLQFQGLDGLPWVIVVFVVGQLVEGMWLTPRLVGERIGLHPVAVIFAVMAGGQLYGFVGVLLALPVAAVAMVMIRHVVATYRAANACVPDVVAGAAQPLPAVDTDDHAVRPDE